jgi:hypothetical protein
MSYASRKEIFPGVYHNVMFSGQDDKDVACANEVLWYNGRLWVPDRMNHKVMFLQEEYDFKVTGHIGQEKKIDLLLKTFFWPQME